MLRNNTVEPIMFTPDLAGGALSVSARLVAYMLPSIGRWSPMLLLRRRQITAPPGQNTAIWLSFDCRDIGEGTYPVTFKAHGHTVHFAIQVNGTLDAAPIPYVGVYAKPYPRASAWEAFRDAGITMLFHTVLSKAEMKHYGFLHLASVPFDNGWAFFSLIYGPPWDDVYTGNQDHAVSLFSGADGRTLSTRNMEAVRESVQRWRKAKLDTANDN